MSKRTVTVASQTKVWNLACAFLCVTIKVSLVEIINLRPKTLWVFCQRWRASKRLKSKLLPILKLLLTTAAEQRHFVFNHGCFFRFKSSLVLFKTLFLPLSHPLSGTSCLPGRSLTAKSNFTEMLNTQLGVCCRRWLYSPSCVVRANSLDKSAKRPTRRSRFRFRSQTQHQFLERMQRKCNRSETDRRTETWQSALHVTSRAYYDEFKSHWKWEI